MLSDDEFRPNKFDMNHLKINGKPSLHNASHSFTISSDVRLHPITFRGMRTVYSSL